LIIFEDIWNVIPNFSTKNFIDCWHFVVENLGSVYKSACLVE